MQLSRKAIAIIVFAVLLLMLFITGVVQWDWGHSVVHMAQSVHDTYGIDIPVAIGFFGVGEALFVVSVAMMLREAGGQVTWGNIRAFKMKNLNLGSRRMLGWLWVNRLAWIVPWVLVIVVSLGKVPWWATLAALGEAGATFAVGMVISLGLRLPWWNEEAGTP